MLVRRVSGDNGCANVFPYSEVVGLFGRLVAGENPADVVRGRRVEVAKRDGVLALPYDVGRNLTGDDLAEQAVRIGGHAAFPARRLGDAPASCKPLPRSARHLGMTAIYSVLRRRGRSTSVEGRTMGDWDADEAVSQLYAANYAGLVRLSYLLVHDRGRAEELVQDAFVAMHGHWHRLREPHKALAYLRRAVVNRSRSELRHRAVVNRHPVEDPPPHESAEAAAVA